jgi:hypothetical protein
MFLICSFIFFLLQEGRIGSAVGEGGVGTSGSGGGGNERGRRMNMVQTMYTHVCKCKNDTC